MIIALDYDDTYTADKDLWDDFVSRAKERGHSVSFVTFRYDGGGEYAGVLYGNEDIIEDAKLLGINIVFTNGKQKQHVHFADIWIDDNPHLCASYVNMHTMVHGCEVNGDLG